MHRLAYMNRQFFRLVGLGISLACLALTACESSEEDVFEVELVTSPAAQAGTCPTAGAGGLTKTGADGVHAIRITFFDAAQGAPSENSFICDRLVAADESGKPFYIRAPRSTTLHILVDAFGAPGSVGDATPLLASGAVYDVPFSKPREAPRIFLPRAGRLGCTLGVMHKARAFHSVTALPGGHALVVGGLVASNGDDKEVNEGSGLLLTNSVEFYDANTGSFTPIDVEGDPGAARAFHSAFLMKDSTSEQARVLILGGVGQGSVPDGDGVVKIRTGPKQPFRLSPTPESDTPAPEMLTVDLTTRPPTVTRDAWPQDVDAWPGRYFQDSTTYGQGGMCVAGGASAILEDGTFVKQQSIDLGFPDSGEHHPQPGSLLVPRVGLTLTGLTPATALAWGGNLEQPDPVSTLAEQITISPAPPSATALAYDAAGSGFVPVATAFHTATLLDDGDVLVVGGFEIEAGLALNPTDATSIYRVELDGNTFRMHGQDATGFVPVGYHAAVRLADGRVLITGGSPAFEPGVSPCITGQNSWTCSLGQAFVYTPGPTSASPGQLDALPGDGLVVPRFGHRMTVLSSGLVLVTGGLRRDDEQLFTEASAEIFNASDGSAIFDVPLGRAPGTLYSPDSECPVY